ncbi:hypothetical protein [Nonomuraea wenchangensis]|uniref:hypothetical protein n=1 Tax=Nonomuraea wenchangensis TaxID=568860 RepID=UPI00331855BF
MNVFARIAQAVDDDGARWQIETGAGAGTCVVASWCREHLVMSSGVVTHLRRVGVATRPDGSVLLAVSVQQLVEADYVWQPVIHLAASYLDADDEPVMLLRQGESELLERHVRYVGDNGERLAEVLMTANDFLVRSAKESLTLVPEASLCL